MPRHCYRIVDVFTERPLEGNPLAVFPDAAGISGELMQRIARELNLSETVFVLRAENPDCAAALRIFTPARELVFAGHPTVGAAFVLLDQGAVPRGEEHFLLEERVGPVPIRIEAGERPLIWLRTPPIAFGRTWERAVCARALGLELGDLLPIDPQLVSAGNPTVFIPLQNREAVDRAFLEAQGLRIIKGDDPQAVCIFVFTPTPEGAYSRMFAPEHGIVEDPGTGSSTGPLAAYMLRHGLIAEQRRRRFLSEQGTKMGRRSLLHIQVSDETRGIEVGGFVTPIAEATMEL